jgi:electron transport complex protein RnfC
MPLSSTSASPAGPVVREGQEVAAASCSPSPTGFVSVAHARAGVGRRPRIGLVPSITGQMVEAIYLEPFPARRRRSPDGTPCRSTRHARGDHRGDPACRHRRPRRRGLPHAREAEAPEGKVVDTLIINGVECEPYLTTDHRVMLEHADDVFTGIRYLLKATGAERAIIGVEANKLDAAEALRAAAPADLPVASRCSREVSAGRREDADHRAARPRGAVRRPAGRRRRVCINVATAAEIGRLLPTAAASRSASSPSAVRPSKRKGNYRIPIGTPLRFALEHVGVSDDVSRVFLGGPMMGQALSSLDIPITKGTSGFVAFTTRTGARAAASIPCIRCGYCVDACPIFLNPSQLGLLAKQRRVRADGRRVPPDGLLRVRLLHLRLPVAHPAGAALSRRQGDAAQSASGGPRVSRRRTLEIRTSPHIASGNSVDTIMRNVVWRCCRCAAFAVYASA